MSQSHTTVRRPKFEILAALAISALAVAASWGTYRQFAPFVTLGTIPIFVLAALIPIGLIAYGRSSFRPFDLIPVLIALLALFSIAWALMPEAWGQQAFYYIACAAFYFSCRLFVRSADTVRLIVVGAAVGGLIGASLVRPIETQWVMQDYRSAIAGLNQNFTAYVFAGTVYLLLLYARFMTIKPMHRLAAWLVCGVLIYSIFALGTRGALLSVGLMVAWDLGSRLLGPRSAPVIAITALLLALTFSSGALDWIGGAVEGLFQRNTGDLSGRSIIWEYARSMIEGHPILGIGAGGFTTLNVMQIGAHNVILTLWLDLGFMGLFLFLALLGSGLWPALSLNSSSQNHYTLGMFACYFFPIAVSGHIELSPFTWLVLALTFTIIRPPPSPIR